ncbi:MAG TPA: HAD family phosphatase [Solirubrobacteraceae bacterium]|nr:HAD family phosphatase [Solirubrobacteraceae bacterium]
MADRHGLIVDYGGVLTSDVFVSFQAFCEAEGLPPDAVRNRFREDPEARRLLAELETGALAVADFEPRFAALLEVRSERLIDRLFGGMAPDEAMLDGVRAARRAGARTALLSNSWGAATAYDPELLEELFDAWVISSEVGLRKPDPAIYELVAERLGLPPSACVFVDDLPGNLKPARALGMATVLHRGDADATLAEVRALLR